MDAAVSRSDTPRVCVLGIWHLGSVAAACLAGLGYEVTAVETSPHRLESLRRGVPPLYEPGLEEMFDREMRAGRLRVSADPESAVESADFVVFAADVPVDDNDAADISGLIAAAETIGPRLRDGAIVIVMSQVPVGTCGGLAEIFRRRRPGADVHVAYSPENLRLGDACARFVHPDMVIIGADTDAARERVREFYRPIDAPQLIMDLRSAEMTKHALNLLLATCISFGNEVAALCEYAGADPFLVTQALRLDRRVGTGLPIAAGPPFSGGTLARDVRALERLAAAAGANAPLLKGVLAANELQKRWVLRKLEQTLGDLSAAAVAVLGLTYKAGTSTLRRSNSVETINALAARGASVTAYDPMADLSELPGPAPFRRASDPYEAARGADAVVIMTEWPEFRMLDWAALGSGVRRRILVDTRNMVEPAAAAAAGFTYYGVGRRA